jgi:hypothetical protein
MADNWTIWSRETTGQTDHGMTTWRMLLLFDRSAHRFRAGIRL